MSPALVPAAGLPERLVDTVYRLLVESILDGRLGGSGRLHPGEIAARFGVSATPVREALMRLAAEGLIETMPRRGFSLRNPSPEEITELWLVRLGLESTAGEIVVERLQAGTLAARDLEGLAAPLKRLGAASRRLSHRDHVALNGHFHQTLIELSGNRRLMALYAGVKHQLVGAWLQRGLADWRSRLAQEAREHDEILAALRAHDAPRFRAELRRHLRRSLGDAISDLAGRAARQPTTPTPSSPSTRRKR